jgi:DNA-directed RNA polymerase subunit RPC12/RpoP
MIGGGRVVGLIMMIGSVVLFLGAGAWLLTSLMSEETATSGGTVLGAVIALIVLAPLFGIGVYLFRQGTQESEQYAVVQQEKKLLNMVLTQGQVTIPQIVAELQAPRDVVEDMIRSLVGKQLFSGAINWEKGILYSVESQSLTGSRKCPNCGGDLRFAGKGLIVCPYCGSEVFLTKRAAAETVENAS